MSAERLNLLWGITMASGATAQLLARLTSLQAVVLLLASGLVVGRAGFHWVEPLDLGSSLGTVVGLLVSLVLFEAASSCGCPEVSCARRCCASWRCACWWPSAGRCWRPTGWLV